jgi:multiple sugar transport system substrate-binding protein
MLKQAGVDPNIVPKDTNEFLDVMEKVYKATGKGATIGGKFQDILRNWIVAALAVTNCGPQKFVAMLNGEPDVSFTDKCSADAFQFIGDMVKRNLWQDGLQTLTIDQADVAFAQGKAAFDFGGSFTLGFLLQQGMKPEDILTFTLPALPSSQQKPIELAPFALIDLAVTKDSKHVKEASDFIKFFTSSEQMAAFAKITGDLPSVPISTDPKVVGDLMATMAKSYVNASKSLLAGWNDAVVASPDVYTATDSVCNKLITGEGTLADALKAADDAAHQDRTRRTK